MNEQTQTTERVVVPADRVTVAQPKTWLVAYQLRGQPSLWTWCGQAGSAAQAEDQALQTAEAEGWNLEDLRCRLVLSGHHMNLYYPVFSPDTP